MVVLPQGVAFATIAGLPPEYGLYAAMVPTVIAALFGSSWHLVSGPTTAISIAVFASVSPHAAPGTPEFIRLVLTLTFLVGLFQLILGLARLGVLVNFISHTVVVGFTAGAALLIAVSQIQHFFGLALPRGLPFYEVLYQSALHAQDISLPATAVGVVTLVVGILVKRFLPRIPYMIVAMVVGALVAVVITRQTAQPGVIATVGALPASLPPLSLPDFSFKALHDMLFPALVVTMLALTEAVSISRAIAAKSEQRIDGNQEFIGQGLSNLVGSFFSAYASSGSFNRSGINFSAGARTPLAAVYAAGFLILFLLLIAPLVAYLPTAAMAAVLFLVAWGLIDFHHIRAITHTHRAEAVILWVTLIGTLVNLEKGIFFGVLLSLVLYLARTSRPRVSSVVPDPEPGSYHYINAGDRLECPQLKMVRVNGSIFFGAVDHVQHQLHEIDEHNPQQKHVLIVASGINFIDVAGAEMLVQEAKRRRRLGGDLWFYRLREGACETLRQGGYAQEIGMDHVFPAKSRPIAAIYPRLDAATCRACPTRIFPECQSHLPDGSPRPPEPDSGQA